MRTVLRVAVIIAFCSGAACTGKVDPAVPPSGRVPAASGSGAPPPGQVRGPALSSGITAVPASAASNCAGIDGSGGSPGLR